MSCHRRTIAQTPRSSAAIETIRIPDSTELPVVVAVYRSSRVARGDDVVEVDGGGSVVVGGTD
jgi:hypothetical protein